MHSVVKIAYRYRPEMHSLNIVIMEGRLLSGSMTHYKHYLKTFGHYLHHIKFVSFGKRMDVGTAKEIFTFIIVYCLGSLRSLKMRGIHLDSDLLAKAHLVFKHMTKLDIDECSNWNDILPMCSELEELRTQCDRHCIPINGNYEFSQLKTFEFAYIGDRFHSPLHSTLERFFVSNSTIKTLSLTVPYDFNVAIIGHLKHLEVLSVRGAFSVYFEQATNYQRLKSLKHLANISIDNTLMHLHIGQCVIDGTDIASLTKFHNLQVLHLEADCDSIDPNSSGLLWIKWSLFERLHQLQKLTLTFRDPANQTELHVSQSQDSPIKNTLCFSLSVNFDTQELDVRSTLLHLEVGRLTANSDIIRDICKIFNLTTLPLVEFHQLFPYLRGISAHDNIRTLKLGMINTSTPSFAQEIFAGVRSGQLLPWVINNVHGENMEVTIILQRSVQ